MVMRRELYNFVQSLASRHKLFQEALAVMRCRAHPKVHAHHSVGGYVPTQLNYYLPGFGSIYQHLPICLRYQNRGYRDSATISIICNNDVLHVSRAEFGVFLGYKDDGMRTLFTGDPHFGDKGAFASSNHHNVNKASLIMRMCPGWRLDHVWSRNVIIFVITMMMPLGIAPHKSAKDSITIEGSSKSGSGA